MSVFYSFHYDRDNWRVHQIMEMGVIEGTPLLNHQEWEKVKRSGDSAIRNWIDSQMRYKSAVIVLAGYQTAGRPWVRYEINRALELGKPLLGVRINGLKDKSGRTDPEGRNPFDFLGFESLLIPLHRPYGYTSTDRYADIRKNLRYWSEDGYRRN